MHSRIISLLTAVALLAGMTGLAQADLIAHWAFDEGVGAETAVDSTGNGYNGEIDTTDYPVITGQSGKIGNSYLFSGSSEAPETGKGGVIVSNTDGLNTFTAATFTGWLYYTENEHLYKPIICKYSGATLGGDPADGATAYMLRVYMDYYSVQGRGKNHGDINIGWSAQNVLSLNDWYHATLTYTGPVYDGVNTGPATMSVYVNGELIQTKTLENQYGMQPCPEEPVALGTYYGPTAAIAAFDGWLDDLGIWNEELSQAKIKALGNVPDVTGLGAYDLAHMEELFDVYDSQGSATIDGLAWEYVASVPTGHEEGEAWLEGGYYYVQLESGSDGVKGAIPEPSTLLLLTTGLLGLLAYAWRKRK